MKGSQASLEQAKIISLHRFAQYKQVIMEGKMRGKARCQRPRRVPQKGKFEAKKFFGNDRF